MRASLTLDWDVVARFLPPTLRTYRRHHHGDQATSSALTHTARPSPRRCSTHEAARSTTLTSRTPQLDTSTSLPGLGPMARSNVGESKGASGLGRHLAEFLVQRDFDVRDVPPHKTSRPATWPSRRQERPARLASRRRRDPDQPTGWPARSSTPPRRARRHTRPDLLVAQRPQVTDQDPRPAPRRTRRPRPRPPRRTARPAARR